MNKFGKNGIYILDEPEAALSPIRQMSLISQMDDELVKGGSQFIIEMYSPILIAYPKSFIYEIKENIERVSYEESDNYNITKDFLNDYKKIGQQFKYMCCIYPTAPFVTADKLRSAMQLMREKNPEQIIPMVEYSFPPQRCNYIDKNGYFQINCGELEGWNLVIRAMTSQEERSCARH